MLQDLLSLLQDTNLDSPEISGHTYKTGNFKVLQQMEVTLSWIFVIVEPKRLQSESSQMQGEKPHQYRPVSFNKATELSFFLG